MPLTLDTTIGGTSANSYASLAEAAAYFAAIPSFAATWVGWSEQAKIARLIEAARAIDRLPILGEKVQPVGSATQALAFPRTVQNDWTIVPPAVKHAQCEAVIALHRGRDAATGEPTQRLAQVNIPGTVSVTYDYDGSRDAATTAGGSFDAVRALLRGLVASRNSIPFVR